MNYLFNTETFDSPFCNIQSVVHKHEYLRFHITRYGIYELPIIRSSNCQQYIIFMNEM